MTITVSIVEDHRATRENLVAMLEKVPGFRCLGAYSSAEAALEQIPLTKPDAVLVDINLPGMNGIECVAELKARNPKLSILMLTKYEESRLIFDSLRAGAMGYLLKTVGIEELCDAIKDLLAGGSPMSMQIARKVVQHFQRLPEPRSDVEKLSPREQEILGLLAEGRYYKEIADQLGISLNTVKTRIHNIYEKLHVQTRTEATIKYLRGQ